MNEDLKPCKYCGKIEEYYCCPTDSLMTTLYHSEDIYEVRNACLELFDLVIAAPYEPTDE